MQLTRNIALHEFDCRDGTPVPQSLIPAARRTAQNLQKIRDWFGRPVIITSGYRTPSHNRAVKGAEHSFHLGRPDEDILAADFRVRGVRIGRVLEVVEGLIRVGVVEDGGLGRYRRVLGRSWVHYDCRPEPARWRG